MKKSMFSLIAGAAIICMNIVRAADRSEEGVPTSPLKIYSGGFSLGALMSLNDELQDVTRQFLRVSFVNTFTLKDRLALFLDADWYIPGVNVGADMGVDLLFLKGDFRPFAGIGAGAHYIDRDEDFGGGFGPSLTLHTGFVLDISENVAVRMRLPYHFIYNEHRDHCAGIDFGFIFFSRFKNVKKLNY